MSHVCEQLEDKEGVQIARIGKTSSEWLWLIELNKDERLGMLVDYCPYCGVNLVAWGVGAIT